MAQLRELFPAREAYDKGHLDVGDGHQIYYEQVGQPDGKPAVILHGGPGGGIAPYYHQFFDTSKYRVVLFDQRGAGNSTPFACLENNTTWKLVEDTERLRKHLGIEKWIVFGGSWGSTLSIAYAETYPERVKGLILRGIFTLRRHELTWFYQEGASFCFPDAWEKYIEPIPEVERFDLISAYHRRLTGNDEQKKLECAKAWSLWELSTSKLYVDPSYMAEAEDEKFALAFARIECHYFVNGGFFESDDQLLRNAHKLKNIPGIIVQGRYDMVCPAKTAWDLHRAWPEAEFVMVPDAGHSCKEPGILHHLVAATDKFYDL